MVDENHDYMTTTVEKLLGKADGYPDPLRITKFEDLPKHVQKEDQLFRVKHLRGQEFNFLVEIIKDSRRNDPRFNKVFATRYKNM